LDDDALLPALRTDPLRPLFRSPRAGVWRGDSIDGTKSAIQYVGSGVAAVVTSELRTDWQDPAVDQTLTRPPDRPIEEVTPRMLSRVPQAEQDTACEPTVSRRRGSGLRIRLLAVDIAAAAGTWLFVGTMNLPSMTAGRRWGAALAASAVTLAAMYLLGLYRSRLCVQRGQETARIVVAVGAGAAILVGLRGDGGRSLGAAIAAAGFCIFALMLLRWVFLQWLRSQRAQGRYLRGLVMIGANEDATAVWTMLHSEPELGYEVRGFIGEPRSGSDLAQLPNSREIDELPDVAKKTDATGVLLVANALCSAEMHHVIELAAANDLHVQIWPGFRGLGTRRVRRHPMSGETFLYVEPGHHPTWQIAAKRAVDLLGATVGLIITAPLLLLAWVLIRLEDGGPALYRQERIGLKERPFVVYKLRTMALHANTGIELEQINERTDGPLFKAAHDPRVTRVGAVLRALSIDELPQLFNVLTGTMSLVGPRPALPQEVDQFDAELLRRHAVKPGLTGLWQLEARDNPSFHAYRRLDLFYVDNWSIGLDLFILLTTVPMVIARAMRISRPGGTPQKASSEAA
jgi:exopolysaccharide biosynthesis polyprenyl glycosylphosphotransferase